MTEEFDPQANELDAFLNGLKNGVTSRNQNLPATNSPTDDHHLPEEEARLAMDLKRQVQNIQPSPAFETALEQKLMQAAHQRRRPHRSSSGAGRWIAWIGLAALLLVGLAWVLGNLIPSSGPAAVSPEVGPGIATPQKTEPLVVSQPTASPTGTPAPIGTPTPLGTIYSVQIQPDVDFLLQTEFPDAPSEVGVYRQARWPELTIESAKAMAAQLGVSGEVYLFPYGPPNSNSYMIWDGSQKVIFFGSPRSFEYKSGNPAMFEVPNCQPPCLAPGTETSLLDFLKEHGLLDFTAESRVSDKSAQVDLLVQTLEGFPLLYRPGEHQGDALISSENEILSLDYMPANTELLGNFPILTAQQAWQAATSMQTIQGIEISSHSVPTSNFELWHHIYPGDEPVELFGGLSVFQSAEGGEPLVLFDDYPIEGNIEGMQAAASNNAFVQVWGKFQQDADGHPKLWVDGWQVSPFPNQTLAGQVVRQDDRAYLNTTELAYLLPDLPSEVPEGKMLTASGVVIEQPELTLAWSVITTEFGGGGGGGGSAFPDLNLEGNSIPLETPTPAPTRPSLAGQRLDGVQGQPYVILHQYTDGSSEVEVYFHPEDGQLDQDISALKLDGPGLAGIEAYHNLPLRIWGTFVDAPGQDQMVSVERYEPVFPKLGVQAWIGRFEPLTLEGKQVLLFTAQDGEQLVLKFSIDDPNRPIDFSPGDPIIVEGYQRPDQSLGGYPVLTDLAFSPGQGIQDLSGYTIQSGKPMLLQETGTAGAARKAVIEGIELAYYTENNRYADLTQDSPLPYIQPVWRFTGTYEDGSPFEILIQALAPQYLAQP